MKTRIRVSQLEPGDSIDPGTFSPAYGANATRRHGRSWTVDNVRRMTDDQICLEFSYPQNTSTYVAPTDTVEVYQ